MVPRDGCTVPWSHPTVPWNDCPAPENECAVPWDRCAVPWKGCLARKSASIRAKEGSHGAVESSPGTVESFRGTAGRLQRIAEWSQRTVQAFPETLREVIAILPFRADTPLLAVEPWSRGAVEPWSRGAVEPWKSWGIFSGTDLLKTPPFLQAYISCLGLSQRDPFQTNVATGGRTVAAAREQRLCEAVLRVTDVCR